MGIENTAGVQSTTNTFKYEVRMGDSLRSIAEKSLFAQGKIENDGKFDGKVSKEDQALLQKEIAKIKAENKKAIHKTAKGTEYFIACDKINLGGDVENTVPIDGKTPHPNARKNVEVTSDKFKGMPVVTHVLKQGETLEGKNGVLYGRIKQMYSKEQTVTQLDGSVKKFPAVTDEAKLLKITEEYSSAIIGAESASERDTRKWQPGREIQIPTARMDVWESFAGKSADGNRKYKSSHAEATLRANAGAETSHLSGTKVVSGYQNDQNLKWGQQTYGSTELPEVVVTAPKRKSKDNPAGTSQLGIYNQRTDFLNVDTPWGKRNEGQVVPPYVYQPE